MRVEFPSSGRGRCPNAPCDSRATGNGRTPIRHPTARHRPDAFGERRGTEHAQRSRGVRTAHAPGTQPTAHTARQPSKSCSADSRRADRAWSSTCGSLRSCVQPRRPPDWGLGESKIPTRLKNATRQFFPAPLRELRLSAFAEGTDVIALPVRRSRPRPRPNLTRNHWRVIEGHDAGREGRKGRT